MSWHSLCPCVSHLNLSVTLLCGQAFRWCQVTTSNAEEGNHDQWLGVVEDQFVRLKQNHLHPGEVAFWCEQANSPEKLRQLLEHYFSLDVDLAKLMSIWCKEASFQSHTQHIAGLRLLRQDPLETLFAFICSSNNNISRITQLVNKLAAHYGNVIATYERQAFHSFPTVEALCADAVEMDLRNKGFGYRAKFISQTAKKLLSLGGRDWLHSLRDLPYEKAVEQLCQLPGIGRKVADCICLHSLGFNNAIPVDTHIYQIAQRLYSADLSSIKAKKALNKSDYDLISHCLQQKWAPQAGWAQAVIFSSDLKHLKIAEPANEEKQKKRKRK